LIFKELLEMHFLGDSGQALDFSGLAALRPPAINKVIHTKPQP
jgi:hypothetical protein